MTNDQGQRTDDGFLDRHRLWILLLLTAVGGVLRFAAPERPPLWGDEAFTYYRASGTFQEMLDILQFNGFPPLHYEAYRALREAHPLTPRTMRIIPAVAGTLMVPAMYFLAAGFVRRRTALLVALFTCCSAYMMVYSRDAKMYMACWLFVTLHVGCLLWWLRAGRSAVGRIAWLAWAACGLAAVGLHHSANLVLPVELIILLTFPRGGQSPSMLRRVPLFLVGTVIVLSGPLGYFVGFNRLDERVEQRGFAYGSETMWVESYNLGRGPMDLALYTATAHLYSWEWPQSLKDRHIEPLLLHGLMIAGVTILLLLATGTLPWPPTKREPSGSAAGRFPAPTPSPTSWHPTLWLAGWIVLIAYPLYCASTKHFASPVDAITAIGSFLGDHWIALAAEVIILALLCQLSQGFARALATAIPVIALLALCAAFMRPSLQPNADWETRYWLALVDWWNWISSPRVLLVLLAALPALAWHHSGNRLADRAAKAGVLLGITAGLFGLVWLIWFGFHRHVLTLIARMATEQHLNKADAEEKVWATWLSIWMPRYLGVIWPAVAIAACALLSHLPTRPLRYAAVAVLLGVNVAQAAGRLFVTTEPPAGRMAADVAASQPRAGPASTRAYFNGMSRFVMPSPGSLSLVGPQLRYYFSQITSRVIKPRDFKYAGLNVQDTASMWGLDLPTDVSPAAVAREAVPAIRRVVVWEKLDVEHPQGSTAELSTALGADWKLVHDEAWTGHDHWTWGQTWTLRRHEFVRR